MKNNKIIFIGIIILVIIIVLVVFAYHSPKGSIQTQESTSTNDLATTTNIAQADQSSQESTSTPIPFTIDLNNPKILAGLRSIRKDPVRMHIREVFNAYLSGNRENLSDPVLHISSSTPGDVDGGFDAFDKSLYLSRFVILSSDGAVGGGEDFYILFLDHPQHIYSAWMYYESEGTSKPSFRIFWRSAVDPPNYGEEMLRLNPRLKTDATLSI